MARLRLNKDSRQESLVVIPETVRTAIAQDMERRKVA